MDTEKTEVVAEEVAPAAEKTSAPQQRMPRQNRNRRKKVCVFCADKIDYIDYKNVKKLEHHISERGKILPRRISGACAKHQRQVVTAIKRARHVALLPYIKSE